MQSSKSDCEVGFSRALVIVACVNQDSPVAETGRSHLRIVVRSRRRQARNMRERAPGEWGINTAATL